MSNNTEFAKRLKTSIIANKIKNNAYNLSDEEFLISKYKEDTINIIKSYIDSEDKIPTKDDIELLSKTFIVTTDWLTCVSDVPPKWFSRLNIPTNIDFSSFDENSSHFSIDGDLMVATEIYSDDLNIEYNEN